jgi:hypothetical protein
MSFREERSAASKIDEAAVYHLKVRLHCMKSENQRAMDSALTCLRGFRIDMPPHPTDKPVQAEYETVWQPLNGHPFGGEFLVRSHIPNGLLTTFTFEVSATEVESYKQMLPPSRIGREVAHLSDPGALAWLPFMHVFR